MVDEEIGYPLESDEEVGRLSNQHEVIKDEMGKLVLAPIDLSRPLRILDSVWHTAYVQGCGSDKAYPGTWIFDLTAFTIPTQHDFVGTDIDPTHFPIEKSSQQSFFVKDINKPWPEEWKESFDLVHQRLVLNGAGHLQREAVDRLLALVKPGGWVQLMETTNHVPASNGPAMRSFDTLMTGVFSWMGSSLSLADDLPAWLQDAGFLDVEHRVVEMRLGRMNSNVHLAKKGTYSCIVAARWLSEFAKSK